MLGRVIHFKISGVPQTACGSEWRGFNVTIDYGRVTCAACIQAIETLGLSVPVIH